MAMVCPQCNVTYEQRLQCPGCGVRLLYQASARRRSSEVCRPEDSWQHTPWGRLFIGLLLAQGLYYVLRNLCTAGLLAAGEASAQSALNTLYGLILLQAFQAVGVVAAGLLVGAGKRQGFLFGLVLGVWNGVLFLLAQQWAGDMLTPITLVGLPLLQAVFGGIGGQVGSWVWKPMPTLSVPGSAPREAARGSGRKTPPFFAGPVSWTRVLMGIGVAVGGVVWANFILEFIVQTSEGKLRLDDHLQSQLVTWEICALSLLAGGAIGGTNCCNGTKQGICVGVGSSSVLLGLGMASGSLSLHLLLFNVTSAISLGLVGGWFGGQLLPPVVPRARRLRAPANV